LAQRGGSLTAISLNDVDEFFEAKRAHGWRLSTIANHAQALRAFFLHAEGRGWCAPKLAAGIRKPTSPKYDGVAKGPTWTDVRRMLRFDRKTTTPSLRGHAILLLCSIYALRSSEVAGLRLSDFDWRKETFCVKRAKRGGFLGGAVGVGAKGTAGRILWSSLTRSLFPTNVSIDAIQI
jgi:integrase/recombinase XerD